MMPLPASSASTARIPDSGFGNAGTISVILETGLDSMTRTALFAYNFPHRKTQDFIFKMFVEGIAPSLIIAADPVKLNIPPASVRTKVRHRGEMHPRDIADRLNIPYVVLPHNSREVVKAVCIG